MTEGYQNLRNRRRVRPSRTEAESQSGDDSAQDIANSANSVEHLEAEAVPQEAQRQKSAVSGEVAGENPGRQTEHLESVPAQPEPDKLANNLANTLANGPVSKPVNRVDIVAELSANHNKDLDLAFRTLRAMADAGADAVKLQSYDAQSLTLPLDQSPFIIEKDTATPSPWDGRSLYSLYEEAAMPWAWHKPLYKLAGQLGLPIFSTPFCLRGVDFLEQLETPCYKIASFEIGHLELLRRVAATGKPIIVSLGIASFADIERLLDTCVAEGNDDVTLLQCTSAYPASASEANLAMLPHLKSTFGCRVGLSDHTLGSTVAVAAVALGAELIEKHFILSREIGGPDASFSLEPDEFAAMVRKIRIAEAAVGQVDYRLNDKKRASRRFGRAIFVLRDLRADEVLQREDVAVLRPFPAGAIEPQELERLIGARLRCDVRYGTALEWHMVEVLQ